jgi:hypothetical protein
LSGLEWPSGFLGNKTSRRELCADLAKRALLTRARWLAELTRELDNFRPHLGERFPSTHLAGRSEWERVKYSERISELQEFADQYPTFLYTPFLRLRVTRLQALATGKYTPVQPASFHRLLKTEEINAMNCTELWTARVYGSGQAERSENSKANRIETMKGPAESRQICSVGRRKIAKKIAKNKRCYANTLTRSRKRSRPGAE